MKNSNRHNYSQHLRTLEYRRPSVTVPTPDDWHPTKNGCVEVTVWLEDLIVRTSVWGADDFGLERIEECLSKDEAAELYKRRQREISNWGLVEIKVLRDLGFVYC